MFTLLFTLPSTALPLKSIEQPIILLNEAAVFDLSQFSAYTKDLDGTQPLEEVITSEQWRMSDQQHLNFGFSTSAVWIAAKVQSTQIQTEWYLRIQYALFDNIQIYLCPESKPTIQKNCTVSLLGDQYPFEQRDVKHPEFISKLDIHNPGIYNLYIRFKTQGSYPLMIQVEDESNLQDDLIINSAIRGGYLSTMLVMGLYNLFLYFSTRSRSYLYYSAFVLTFMLFHATYAGSAFQFLWPNHPNVNNFAFPIIFSLNMVALALFIPKFLNLRKYGPKSFYLFRFYLAAGLFCVIISPIAPYQPIMKTLNILNMVFTLSALIISARFWILGNRAARFFTIAWLAFIVGLLLATSRSLGLIPLNSITYNGYQLGSFIEIILLSLALGERITHLQRDKEESKKALFSSQEESIKNLKKYEDLYQNSLTGQFQLNNKADYIKLNPAWRKIISNEDEQDCNIQNFNQCFLSQVESEDFWRKVERLGAIKNLTVELRDTNKKPIYVDLSMRKGDDSAWIGSAQDVTEKYLQEQTLKQLQHEKNQSLRQLVMGVSHEMNTPLGNIKMAQSFLEDHIKTLSNDIKPTFIDGLDIVAQGSNRLQELGSIMKSSVAAERSYICQDIDLISWLSNWSEVQEELFKNLNLECINGCQEANINTYPDVLTEIFDQLTNNSISHNESLYESGGLKVSVSIRTNENNFIIDYTDNGSGITKEQRSNIFQPFYTTQRQRATNKGLGMYHIYNLITEVLSGNVIWPEQEISGFMLSISIPITLKRN